MRWNLALLALAAVLMGGCAAKPKLVSPGTSGRTDVVRVVQKGSAPEKGIADLRVLLSVKTHKPGIYSADDPHGTADHKLHLNFDGHAIDVAGTMAAENVEPAGPRDAEGGDGVRYTFDAHLRLTAGSHIVVISLPADEVVVARELTLPEGHNTLVLEPVYRASAGQGLATYPGASSFKEGISSLRVIVNGREN